MGWSSASDSSTFTGSYTITQADLDAGAVVNAASVTGTPPTGPPVTDEDEETVPGTQDPAITLVKTAEPGSFDAVGDEITYTFTATNTGDVTLSDVVVEDLLPGGVATQALAGTPVAMGTRKWSM